jgi:K+-sensing histidine kinase KdpD
VEIAQSSFRRYALGLLFVAIGTLAGFALDGAVRFPVFVLLEISVTAATFTCGVGPGIAASLGATAVSSFLLLPPRFTFSFGWPTWSLAFCYLLCAALPLVLRGRVRPSVRN